MKLRLLGYLNLNYFYNIFLFRRQQTDIGEQFLGVVVGVRVPEAPAAHLRTGSPLLPYQALHHYLVPFELQFCGNVLYYYRLLPC